MRHFIYIFLLLTSIYSFGQSNNNLSIKEVYKKAVIENDISTQKSTAKELKSSYTLNELNYYKTVLKSIQSNAILVTNGLEDTYPITILQQTEGLKSNVDVISLRLMDELEYRNRILEKYQLPVGFNKTSKSIYLSRIIQAKGAIYISNTVNPTYYNDYNNKMFLVGLILKLNAPNQFQDLNEFWDDLKKKNQYKFSLSTKEKGIYSNYLPPLLTLYKMKIEVGTNDENLKNGILYLAKILNNETTVKNIIEQYEKGG